ncbi:helix-turn-helix domain-containing protein [Paenibacillus sp. JSM ZJ436]|uniref:Transcriptional regulator, AraC family n=1 Tax=Paenibacillus algicola TaxID=2565926 RepID=A0A4P8XLL3_9BACL|nr:AraC family transcriptional regulator [Paenibacillus algicola]QCT03646.1 transcriptional regulator, AraC family [Paenibacillus algicola]
MNGHHVMNFLDRPFHGNFKVQADHTYTGFFHYHPGLEFLYVHQGDGTVVLEQQVYKIEQGALFIFQPFQLHHVKAQLSKETPYIRSTIHFDPEVFNRYFQSFYEIDRFFQYIWKGSLTKQVFPSFSEQLPIEPLISYYKEKITESVGNLKLEYQALLLQQLMVFLYDGLNQSESLNSYSLRTTTHTEDILQWVEQHFSEPFKLEAIAEELHLSKYHISHLFKRDTGSTITNYILARRIKEACMLLSTTQLSISEIGLSVGWPIPSHFVHQFKMITGMTPLQFRKDRASNARM